MEKKLVLSKKDFTIAMKKSNIPTFPAPRHLFFGYCQPERDTFNCFLIPFLYSSDSIIPFTPAPFTFSST